MEADENRHIEYAISEIRGIQAAVASSSNGLHRYMIAARSVIEILSSTTVMQRPVRAADKALIISTLQGLAYLEPDSGGIQDIAEWCVAQWLRLLQYDSESLDALQGLGQAWLSRAQSALARIHRQEGSSSSGGSSGRPGTGNNAAYTSSDEARDAARAAAEADARIHTADYVEARGILLPSTEYFSRAVDAAEGQARITGSLLASAAEAYMSLGNVSYSYVNEQYFRQALLYLRRASQLQGYSLTLYLQNYLDDYGRLID